MKSVFELLKTLFSHKDSDLTILLYDDQTADESSAAFRVRPRYLVRLLYGSAIFLVILVLSLVAFTPLRTVIVPGSGPEVRKQVIQISQRVNALEDSIRVRERQLQQMKQVLLKEKDTTFAVSNTEVNTINNKGQTPGNVQMEQFYHPLTPEKLVNQTDLIASSRINRAPEFPTPFPVEGSFTRGINREEGHFGIDIATASGAPVFAVADGTIIGSSWTPNYGYVLRIQHARGYVSVYKHCLSLLHDEGDVVQKGDLIGEVGDVGILSSGPHLHFELWRKGIPLDPRQFLTQRQ